MPIPKDEWMRRYQARFIAVGALDEEQAAEYAKTETFEVLSQMFEDDPEGAADNEMTYWEA